MNSPIRAGVGSCVAMWQLFDIVQSALRENIHMTVKIFCVCSSVDVCGTKARMHICI